MGKQSLQALVVCGLGLAGLVGMNGCSTGASSGSGGKAAVPAIVTQPVAANVYVGDVASFTVAVSGEPVPTLQWLRNGTAIPGQTAPTYTTAATTMADDGSMISVSATNPSGTVTSNAVKLSVAVKPVSITTQPSNQTVTDGSDATFTVAAVGTAPLTYQWKRGGSPISGATGASYTLTAAQMNDSGAVFSVDVSNSSGTVSSSTASLTVNAAAVAITGEPGGATQFSGETATFSVTVTGTAPTFQWRKDGSAIPGATQATYTTPAVSTSDDNAKFDVVVSNQAGAVTSSAAVLRVGPFATQYKTQKGVVLSLYAWPGSKNAVLTKSATLDPVVMRRIVTVADGTWNYYAGAVGQTPGLYFNYNGLATIAETGVGGVDLCGAGCTYIGATGMEISDDSFNTLYKYAAVNQWDQVIFYEFGRSFWLFGSQLTNSAAPNYGGCITTGFAVLMRYQSIAAQNLQGLWNNSPAQYGQLYSDTLGLIDNYANNPAQNFGNVFYTSTYSGTSGLGCTDLFASLVLRLERDYGGEAFIQALWKEALKRPAAASAQDAYDNFFLAACAAAKTNLTTTFVTTWKWTISSTATNTAQSLYGAAH